MKSTFGKPTRPILGASTPRRATGFSGGLAAGLRAGSKVNLGTPAPRAPARPRRTPDDVMREGFNPEGPPRKQTLGDDPEV